ncbi:F-box domain protein [Dictyocaulus viviparus]|uniref:F-box domain protein n=1 Tax=Dictyocaulus viviparus TaxID=29172 RepID=A0A0D8XE35_DICVI|nr:F-box domain protein [Dictyocaulus viviparus]
MSFLNLRALRTPKVTTITSISDEALVAIFERCDEVTILRCSNVCRRWRTLIFLEERKPNPHVQRAQHAVGIFIVDRRRAILERIHLGTEPPKLTATRSERSSMIMSIRPRRITRGSNVQKTSTESSLSQETTTLFMEDQFVDQTQSSWAFTFDFTVWAKKHHVVELTPPWSGGVAERSQLDTVCFGGVKSEQRGYAYFQLPSARALMAHNPPMTVLDNDAIAELTNLSAGRLERLAQALKVIHPLHIVFRDHSLYAHRPTLLLIWFLGLLKPSLRRVTFDGIQAHHLIPLHKILDISGIDELNVKQPQFSPAICVSHRLLLSWLALPSQQRRKLRMRLSGCRTMTARGLAVFVQAWKTTVEPCVFDQISIDLRSVPVYDFLAEMETPTKDLDEPEDWRPPTPPAAAYGHGPMAALSRWKDCKLTIKHRKGNAVINMVVAEGFLVLKCSSTHARSGYMLTTVNGRNVIPRPTSVQCFDGKAKSS